MFVKNAKKLFASASLFSILLALSGCGVWTDFTTYFNTYYNAKTLFDQVEEEIKNQKKDIFIFREDLQTSSQYGSQFGTQYPAQSANTQYGSQQSNLDERTQSGANQYGGTRTGTLLSTSLNENLKKVIEKCSKILQYEKNSSYFADALFITGKALYYQQEYARAQRKFNELAVLGKTKYSSENKLWLAKTDLQLRSFDEGLKLIDEVKIEAINDGNENLFNDASITKIAFLIFRDDLRGAIAECKNYLSESTDDEISALVSYQMGKINLDLNDPKSALDAFTDVAKYSPTVDIDFKSRFESAKLLKTLKRVDESELAFNNLRYLGKFKNYLDQVLIEIGQIHIEKNQVNLAIDIFREVDTTYRQLPTSGIAEMKLAEIYHKNLGQYDSSYSYYNKASISMTTRDIRLEATKRAANFNKYFGFKDEERSLNRNLEYLNDSHAFLRDSIEYQIAYRQYLDDVKAMSETQKTDPNLINQQQFDPIYYQQQYNQQQFALLQKPKKGVVPTPSQLIAVGKYKKPERPNLSADSTRTNLSQSLYNLATLFYSELDVPDSAYFYFNKILENFSDKPIKVQTMYALATYYETLNDSVKADSMFRYIYDNYKNNPLESAAAKKLGLVKKEEKKIEIQKTADPAEKYFLEAEQLYYNKKYIAAIDSFRSVSKRFRASSFAPKSFYYMGMIYENELKMYDSAAAAYLQIINDYSNSTLAKTVSAKYTEYKNEKELLKRKEEDKRKELEAKQKEKEIIFPEKKETKPQTRVEQVKPKKSETIIEKEEIKNIVPKDSLFKKDTTKVGDRLNSNGDSLNTKNDTTKLKPIKIVE